MAYISELHYSNAYANTSSTAEFVEVILGPGEDPADFRVSFYQQNGTEGLVVSLTDAGVAGFAIGGGRTAYVLDGGVLNFQITSPTSGTPNNFEGIALTDVSGPSNLVLDFYTIGSGGTITATNGLAFGVTSTNLPGQGNIAGVALQIDENGTVTQEGHTRGMACFCAGAAIRVPGGYRRVEELGPGDLVCTEDAGVQVVKWAGCRTVRAQDDLAPVCIQKGTLGAQKDVWVSPQHRICLTSWQAQLFYGVDEILVPAKSLVNGTTIRQVPRRSVTYVHIMFDQHQLINSDGVISESFFPGAQALDTLGLETLNELLKIFPELCEYPQNYGTTARQVIRGSEARVLALS